LVKFHSDGKRSDTKSDQCISTFCFAKRLSHPFAFGSGGDNDQSPGGSATTQALRTGTPTAWPALIVDATALTSYLLGASAIEVVRVEETNRAFHADSC
jgi:hypothetical protein